MALFRRSPGTCCFGEQGSVSGHEGETAQDWFGMVNGVRSPLRVNFEEPCDLHLGLLRK
jgi:hypothetical protein